MYKFRTMVVNAEAGGVYSDNNDPRVTKIGNVLRKTSFDELPQCINILKGDMSLVGFRPPLTYHPWPYDQYSDKQKKMFTLRPGITGWAQVNGRKTVEWNKRIEYIIDEILDQYAYADESTRPWIIGFSGGKDSTVLLMLVWIALEKLKELPGPFQLRRPIYVVCNDTMVENPIIVSYVDQVLEQIEKKAKENLKKI